LKKSILKIRNLTKSYGSLKAVNALNLEIREGEVFGILGPNGSGKTTTLGMVLDVLKADQGSYSWFGQKPSATQRKRIGAILEEPLFYPYLHAVANLKIVADLKRLPYSYIDDALKLVGLYDRRKDMFKTYSYGMRQRLALAAAMLGNPDVLILDEPTNGLDPQGIADIRHLITKISKEGITIILASHLLDEVQKVCTHVAVLNKGTLLNSGSVEAVLSEKRTVEMAATDLEQLQQVLYQTDGVEGIVMENQKVVAKIEDTITGEALNRMLFEKGVVLSHLSVKQQSLESYFLELLTNHQNN
jgi:ABC-2 type transport system ATP-binding protein